MAITKYTSSHTGEQIDAAVSKGIKLPELIPGDSGKHITVFVSNNVPYMIAQEVYSSSIGVLYSNSWTENVQNNFTTYTQTLAPVKQAGDNVRVSPAQTWTGATDQDVLNNNYAISDATIFKITEADGDSTGLTFTCETRPSIDLRVLIEVYK